MEPPDAVIVGAGLSGLAAAYYLADAGMEVVVLERGDLPGSKNVTGGRLYLGPIREMIPELLDGAPMERMITRESLSLMSEDASTTLTFRSEALTNPRCLSYTLLRARLDRWLGDLAMEKGAMVIPQKRVDEVVVEDGRAVGVRSEGEELRARVVILAEGVLGMICQQMGLRPPIEPREVATGVKEVIQLPKGTLEERFSLGPQEGEARLMVGSITRGFLGGAFLYTNSDSISLGVVVRTDALLQGGEDLQGHRLMEALKCRSDIAPYLEGGKTVEYSAHLIPESAGRWIQRPFGNGYLVVGDAAGFAINAGITVRGMDLALASGRLAAQAVIEAKKEGDFSADGLACYGRMLEKSFVMRELRAMEGAPRALENPRLYGLYPQWVNQMMQGLFSVCDRPKGKLSTSVYRSIKEGPGIAGILKDLWSLRGL
jgi:electron transfer flavoprotein-quinone oxidoreductase